MILGAMGDLHHRKTSPKLRTDNYPDTLRRKWEWALKEAKRLGVEYMLLPGDIYDSHDAPYALVVYLLRSMKRSKLEFGVVWGQHDQRYHSTKKNNTPLGVLSNTAADALGATPLVFVEDDDSEIHLYGMSWGEPLPIIQDHNAYNILCCHKHIYAVAEGWEGEDAVEALKYLKSSPFDLIVSGDNHKQFVRTHKQKWLVNAGSLGRSKVDQVDHFPAFYVIDTKERKVTRVEIPHDPVDVVFNMEEYQHQKERKNELEQFTSSLKAGKRISLNFKKNVMDALEENKKALSKDTKDIILEVMS